jgi:outer membrane protein OmpA-like peptidoglycan-associated protein
VIPPPATADAPMAPPPAPTISNTAGTTIDTLPPKDGAGVRLDFASGESDLTPGTADAVKALVAAAPNTDQTTFNVMAYATGAPEDPSTARRLSLSRALSVRSALMAYGVPSTRIYVRALGAQAGEGPADRVDVLVLGANTPGPAPGAPANPASATP